jgi:hypothetical protein
MREWPKEEGLRKGSLVKLTEEALATSWGQRLDPDKVYRIHSVNHHADSDTSVSLVPAEIPEEEVEKADLLPFPLAIKHLERTVVH